MTSRYPSLPSFPFSHPTGWLTFLQQFAQLLLWKQNSSDRFGLQEFPVLTVRPMPFCLAQPHLYGSRFPEGYLQDTKQDASDTAMGQFVNRKLLEDLQ